MRFFTKEPILQKIIMYVIVSCFGITSIISLHSILEYKVNQFDRKEANEQTKNTLSLFVQKRVLSIQNHFQHMLLASSKNELELANQCVLEDLESVRKAIQVLMEGGELKETFFVNFDKQEYNDQVLVYQPEKDQSVSLSAIEMRTNMIRLEEMRKEYYNQLGPYVHQTGDPPDNSLISEATLFHKQIAPFFQRILEDSNRLYFESLDALNNASQAKQHQGRVYEFLSGLTALFAMLSVIFIGIWISRDIKVILEERKSAQDALLSTNENLELLVSERTETLRTEVQERRQAEAQLATQAAFLTTVIESFNHPFYVIDIDSYEIEIANQAAQDLHKDPKTHCYALTHHCDTPCDGEQHPCPIQQILKTRDAVVLEHTHYDKDGAPLNVEVHACPIFNESGKITQMIEYSLEITEQKNAQAALKKSRDDLEALVIQRTRNLELEIQRGTETQAELEKSERHFRTLIENINDIILIADESGRIKFISSSVERVLGYHPDEITGQKMARFIQPDEFEGERRQFDEFLAFAKTVTRVEHRILHKNGTFRMMESSLRFMLDDPDIAGIIFTSRDVTDRKETEQMQRKLMLVVEQTPNTVVITDTQGNIEYVNPAFVRTTGYQYEEAIGQNPRILNSGQVPAEVFRNMWATLEKGEAWNGEFINKKRSGELYTENVVVAPLRDDAGTITHYVAIKENITELVRARKLAEAATKAKSEFLANMSHEIRTPMNAIIGLSHLCLTTDLDSRQRDYIEKVHHSSQLLLRIINDILDFSKIEAGRLDLESIPFSLEGVFNNLSNLISATASEKGLEFVIVIDPEIPDSLVGDPLRLGQVLINLANNAIKFTETGHVTVRTALVKTENRKVVLRFSVHDTGIGMTSTETEVLFKPFSQADASTTRKFGGTGLGLTICRRLVILMGGTIGVESTPDVGSIFYFTANIRKQETDAATFRNVPAELKDQRMLVVDDNADARDMLTKLAREFSLSVRIAPSGDTAIPLIKDAFIAGHPFDLILMDYRMPGMNGIETIRQIQPIPGLSASKIVLMTERSQDEILPENQPEALSGVLIKPVLPSDFYKTIICDVLKGCGPENHQKDVTSTIESVTALSQLAGARVLLVDDHTVNQLLATELLKQVQVIVTCVDNGKVAVDTIKRSHFDAVLMDIQMPLMDGHEATRAIRRDERFKGLPIIAMTAGIMAEERKKCLESGMNDHLAKPIAPKELYAKLAKWIRAGERKAPDGLKSLHISPSKVANHPLPQLPGFDVIGGLARLGGNITAYRKALDTFLETDADAVDRIRQCQATGDLEKAEHIAHTLKGVAGNIGAGKLQSAAEELETGLRENITEFSETLITALDQQLSDAMRKIEEFNSASQESQPHIAEKPVDTSALRSIVENLKAEMETYSASAGKTCDELIKLLRGSPAESAAISLGKALDAYAFDQTQKLFSQLMEKLDIKL